MEEDKQHPLSGVLPFIDLMMLISESWLPGILTTMNVLPSGCHQGTKIVTDADPERVPQNEIDIPCLDKTLQHV